MCREVYLVNVLGDRVGNRSTGEGLKKQTWVYAAASEMLNLLAAGLDNQGSNSPSLSDFRLQLGGSQSFLGSLQARIPFLFPNESSLITCWRTWFLSWRIRVRCRRQNRYWTWEAFHRNARGLVYLKESEGTTLHKETRDRLLISKRQKGICHNGASEMLLVKASSLPGFPLQLEPLK